MPTGELTAIDTNEASPLVDGETLAARTKQRPLHLAKALDIAAAG